jgi:hypothetical protein
MKARMLISIFILFLAVLIIVESCATLKKPYIPTENEEYYGTWVNPEYNNSIRLVSAKVVNNPDGTWFSYMSVANSQSSSKGWFKIIKKWTDSEGNIWYRVDFNDPGVEIIRHQLTKIRNSGNTMESVFSAAEYPKKLDKDNLNYRIRYRL